MVATRHSIARVIQQSQPSLYICKSCRHHLSRAAIPAQQQRYASKHDLSTITKFRQRLAKINDVPRQCGPSGKRGVSGLWRRQKSEDEVDASEQASITASKVDEYDPAETWDGLEFVGSEGNWADAPPQPTDAFDSWLDEVLNKAKTRSDLVSNLHRALVECLTAKEAGLDLSTVVFPDTTCPEGDNDSGIQAFESAAIISGGTDNTLQVQHDPGYDAKDMLNRIGVIVPNPGEVVETEPGYMLRHEVLDESFLQLSLDMQNPVTFHVLKRFSFMCGHRIPDPILNTMFSSNKPLSFLIEKLDETILRPKPKKLADVLLNKPELLNQGNLMVFPRRETPVDREKEVGRWKVIEKELIDRGLPLPGRKWHS